MFSDLDSLYTIRTRAIPEDCVCRWLQRGDRPWELLTAYATCPRHGWVDRTSRDAEAVLDWLMADWIIDPPTQLTADVRTCRRAPGWLPAAAFGRLAELVIEHATPCWLWPVIQGVFATAKPATTAWPSPERAATALLPYPTIPTGRVLP